MGVKKKNRAFLICFTGLDGSGKSTLAKALVSDLKAHGVESRYVYGRFEPSLIKPILFIGRVLFFRGQRHDGDYRQYSAQRYKVFRSPFMSVAYQFLMLFDYWLQMLIKTVVPLKLGKTVVCDRYTYDTVINLAVDLDYSNNRMNKVFDLYSKLLPKPERVFLMDVPEEIALQRKDDIPSIDYLIERREHYLLLGKRCGATILDATEGLKELESKIRNKILDEVEPDG